jgi:isopenicillin-N epimerase
MPLLGKAVRHEWALDWDFLSVNHGSFGAAPRVVLVAQQDWQRRMEAQPGRFMRAVLPDALRHAADRLGSFIGADGKDIAFVDNATTGCNAVLRSLRLQPGDEIVVLTHGYGAVRNTVRYVAERAGARMVEALVPFPHPQADTIVGNIAAALTKRTRLAVVDHITSGSALVLPLQQIVGVCHDAGVPVLVDGAHGPAQVALDVRAIGADWYAGNCHKWLCAPKGSAFLYAAPQRQQDLHQIGRAHV